MKHIVIRYSSIGELYYMSAVFFESPLSQMNDLVLLFHTTLMAPLYYVYVIVTT